MWSAENFSQSANVKAKLDTKSWGLIWIPIIRFHIILSFPYCKHCIYSKYWDTLTPYHTCLKKMNKWCVLTLVLLNLDITLVLMSLLSCWTWIYPAFANSVEPDQLASQKPTDLDLHCLPVSMWIYINNLDQVIWSAENLKRAWHLNLFSRTRVKTTGWMTSNADPDHATFRHDFGWL